MRHETPEKYGDDGIVNMK
jgi:hypothetical protein